MQTQQPLNYSSLEETREIFSSNFRKALSSTKSNKFLLDGVVGLGKTECLRHLCSFTHEKAVICFPTHDLKEEFLSSVKNKSLFFSTPRPPSSLSSFLQKIKNDFKENPSLFFSKIKNKFPDFYSSLENSINFHENIVTTHDAFLCASHRFIHQSLIIFDELPSKLFGQIVSESIFSISELIFILQGNMFEQKNEIIKSLEDLEKKIKRCNPFLHSEDGIIFKRILNNLSNEQRLILKQFKDNQSFTKIFTNTISILQSDTFICNYLSLTISTFSRNEFPENKKIICFSATPNKELFKLHKFKILSSPIPKLLSSIIHIPISTSKVSLSSKERQKEINNIIKMNNIEISISYKDVYFRNQVSDVYFGNSEGTNKYAEKDSLAVIGTPMFPLSFFYEQCILNNKISFRKDDFLMIEKEIDVEGVKIKYRTFQHPWLTQQHIDQIRSSLVQVIGRLRPFTRKSKIFLFSKLPFMCSENLYQQQ